MQTILGASGQIARELARELKRSYTDDLRLVSRSPRKVNASDVTVAANLLDAEQTREAVKGSSIVYFAAGLPTNSALWEQQFPTMLKNALDATRAAGARFVYFDNTYMYPQNGDPQTEETRFAPRAERKSACADDKQGAGGDGTRSHSGRYRARARVLWTGKDAEFYQRPDHRQTENRRTATRTGT